MREIIRVKQIISHKGSKRKHVLCKNFNGIGKNLHNTTRLTIYYVSVYYASNKTCSSIRYSGASSRVRCSRMASKPAFQKSVRGRNSEVVISLIVRTEMFLVKFFLLAIVPSDEVARPRIFYSIRSP